MKKIGKWVLYILLMLIGGLTGRALVVYSMTGHFGLNKPNYTNTNFTYTDTNLGWVKLSLPFALEENIQNARQLQEAVNDAARTSVVQNVKLYAGTYDKNKFYCGVQLFTYDPTVPLDPLNALGGTIAGAGFTTEAQRAMQQAQPIKENGSIKYTYQAESKLKNTSAVFGAAVCVKNNQAIILFSNGNNNATNRNLIDHILATTECFPEKK